MNAPIAVALAAAGMLLASTSATAETADATPFGVTGRIAPNGEYQYVAKIRIPNGCTATLVDPLWLLTAAHCITGSRASRDPLAISPRRPLDDTVRSLAFEPFSAGYELRYGTLPDGTPALKPAPIIRRAIPYPDYRHGHRIHGDHLGQHDLALVQLWYPITDREPIVVCRIDPLRSCGFDPDCTVANR